MIVQEILKSKGDSTVATVSPQTLVSEAAKILAERRIGGVIVSSDGETPEGILSERDIVRALAVKGALCMQESVSEMMTRNPVCAQLNETADAVLAHMTEGRFRHMPVVQDGKMVGIITIGDVVKARLTELSMERDALEGMVMGF